MLIPVVELSVDLNQLVPVVRISGDLRLWGKQGVSDQIRETLHELMLAGHKRIILNMTGVNRIDSRGIGCLARCHATAITCKSEIDLVVPAGFVLNTLVQLNFVRLYPIYPDEAKALAAHPPKSSAVPKSMDPGETLH